MTKNNHLPIFDTAYDVLAFVLQLKKHPKLSNHYIDKNKIVYRRTKWGFEKAEKHNLRIGLRRKERLFDQLQNEHDRLQYEHQLVLKRKTGLLKHLEMADEKIKQYKKEKGFFKKHLKEVLDKNTSLEKRMERMLKNEENLHSQIEKLKKTKDNLQEQNQYLTEKSRHQKAQINSFQKLLDQRKEIKSQERTSV